MSNFVTKTFTSAPAKALRGTVTAPGDKSVSHRAMIFGALAEGITTVEGLLEGDDILATKDAMVAFGADISKREDGQWRVVGKGGFAEPENVVDCGNAGTGVRLIMGAAAGFDLCVTFTGDHSLIKRPMGRVLDPLSSMGATCLSRSKGRLPLTLKGGALKGISYRLPMASAQVKSALLLAGLNAEGVTEIIEPEKTRDHTERMLKGFGAELEITDHNDGRHIKIKGGQKLKATHVFVPGDPSSAAFVIVAALITPDSDVTISGVMLNPLRIGLYDTLKEMGADITYANVRDEAGETVGDMRARFSKLKGVVVPPERAPAMIDEYPILCVAAACAAGETIMRGIGEMRVKESDRIALMVAGLSACGVNITEEPEGMVVTGGGAIAGGATVNTNGDHRIAMSHLILGLVAQNPISVLEPEMIATSFPTFVGLMNGLGAKIG
jgi:3-phosphoshikimate 1-carboxyvinyltransferase